MNKSQISVLGLLIVLLFSGQLVFAQDENITLKEAPLNKEYSIRLDKETIAKGYTVTAFDKLKLSLVPGILNEATPVEVIELNEEMPMPWQFEKISNIYQFEFTNKLAYDNHKPFYIEFHYEELDGGYKQVYFFDKNFGSWRPLPTKDYPEEKFVRSLIHLPYARIAVFSDNKRMTSGEASWYAYKGGNFAASPDFPKGSILRVTNTYNNKYVDVVVNDYGPDRSIFPDRAIDLDKLAFAKISPLGAGIIDVKIEPLKILSDADGRVVGVSAQGAREEPDISSRAAIIYNEETEEILFKKKATTTMPLASLTKLVAMKIFLDTKPSLNQVVEYKYQDEAYNYEWVKSWESARLKVEEGETMTIEDLVYSSLVGSANNTIESLVRVSGLPRDTFIKKMNDTVKSWGASSTVFLEPTGLSPENMTTAYDYALITKQVFKNPIIQKASTMPKYEFYTENTEDYHRLVNTNNLVRHSHLNYDITGSKTGYLHEALHCLMVRLKDANGDQLVVVTLGSETKDISLNETQELMDFALKINN
ncbi:MAG: serine hydrolase [Patescibacteria group bacterium]|jgi:D-alanyl-D-alanine endopeptidase (penicillin-binding protein 7)|nr:serine hydrolase [Patescibacteria group bacterium]